MSRILKNLGFSETRKHGSHRIFKDDFGKIVVIPFHGDDLGRGLIRKILNELEITVDYYKELKGKL